jgi:sigma-E processing peptidase SpoIIGA
VSAIYIELYIFDNFLMNCLVIRLSEAILGRRAHKWLKLLICFLASVYALLAYYFPALNLWFFKILLCAAMAICFRIKGIRELLGSVAAVFVSTALIGGATFALVYAFSGSMSGGILYAPSGFRVLLYSVGAGVALPSIFRKLTKRRVKAKLKVPVRIIHKNESYDFEGFIDTGNLLTEPISSLPVIVLCSPKLIEYCDTNIPYSDTSGAGTMSAFLPEHIYIDGIEISAYIAINERGKDMPAIVPVLALPHKSKGVEENAESSAISVL